MSTKNYNGWQDIQTLQSKEIISELIEAKENRLARLLVSDTGLGKTNTIKIFKRKLNANTYVITVGDSFKLVDVLDSILLQLEITTQKSETRIREKLHTITEALKNLNGKSKPIIIIDEAENLKPNSLRMMKELYDHIIDYCSLVLIGTEQILETIHNKRRRNRTGVPQLWRRFKAGTRYITPINKARDFVPFFEKYIPGETDLQDSLLELCENYGELHDYLEPVLRHASTNNQAVTDQLFRFIHKLPPRRNQIAKRA